MFWLKWEAGTGLEKTVVVGVPAFNEEKTIAKVVVEARKYAGKLLFVMTVQLT